MNKSRSVLLVEKINLFLEWGIINEASLKRLEQHLLSNRAFAMITAFRGNFSKKKNRERNKELADAVQREGYGFFKIEGHYPEIPDNVDVEDEQNNNFEDVKDVFTSGVRRNLHNYTEDEGIPDNAVDVKEESFFIIDHKNNPIRFREFVARLGAKYGQDSIFYKDPKGKCYFLYTRDVDGFHKGQLKKINGLLLTDPQDMGRFFSKVKGKEFSFKV